MTISAGCMRQWSFCFCFFVLPSLVWQPRAMMGAHVESPGGSVCECTVSAPYPSTRVADCHRLWSVFIWNYATPGLLDRNGLLKGTDFLHFYTIGTLAREGHPNQLYDLRAQEKLATERVPEAKGLVYAPFYGPQVALLFAPFAALPYGKALTAWLLINAFIYAGCCWLVWRSLSEFAEEPRDCVADCARLSCIFPFAGVGTDIGTRISLLYCDVSLSSPQK